MALSATMRRFTISLSDVDRSVYQELELRVAQHPSESDAYLVTRLLAYCLELREGLSFGRGVSTPEDPTIAATDLRGDLTLWVEIGQPSPERLHKITKQAPEVAVYTHKNPDPIAEALHSGEVFRGDEVALFALAPEFIDEIAGHLDRTNRWELLRSEGELYLSTGELTHQGTLQVLFDPR
ncbi:hypothetical protein DL240_17145 [Lujinxingia litoralis]|uniref:YaeQ family protein n=1 Tax=Lujinxingia litoralis TaxID=2211119 RepID=A0A328C139_9DELT|nr:YaeQ family protein [Lujinxingia litoralis]RAL20308.1 hypothetical protein DL240_17145 [Lujinxingia litoralis]